MNDNDGSCTFFAVKLWIKTFFFIFTTQILFILSHLYCNYFIILLKYSCCIRLHNLQVYDMYAWLLLHFSCVRLFVTPQTVALQAPLSMALSRQEYWSALPCPLPGDLPDPGIKPASLMSPALAGGFFPTSATWVALSYYSDSQFLKVILHL